jgi:hypothetical protein
MKKIFEYVLVLLLMAGSSRAALSEAEQRANVKLQLRQMHEALMREDLDSFLTFMPTDLLAQFGGHDSLVKVMKPTLKQVLAALKSFSIGEPSNIYRHGQQLQCLISDTVVALVDTGLVSTLEESLGVSNDSGKSWKFINAGFAIVNFPEFKQLQPLAPEVEATLREKFVLPK